MSRGVASPGLRRAGGRGLPGRPRPSAPWPGLSRPGTHSETGEALVLYRTLYGNYSYWARPVRMFEETVERNGYIGPRLVRVA
ncbi:DUF1653 domain-containing protein [Sinomonas sp. RB5]